MTGVVRSAKAAAPHVRTTTATRTKGSSRCFRSARCDGAAGPGGGSILSASAATNENDPATRHRAGALAPGGGPSPLLAALAAMEGFSARAGAAEPRPIALEPAETANAQDRDWSLRDRGRRKLKPSWFPGRGPKSRRLASPSREPARAEAPDETPKAEVANWLPGEIPSRDGVGRRSSGIDDQRNPRPEIERRAALGSSRRDRRRALAAADRSDQRHRRHRPVQAADPGDDDHGRAARRRDRAVDAEEI